MQNSQNKELVSKYLKTNNVLTDNGEYDWFTTAKTYCESKNMILPTYEMLDNIYANRTAEFSSDTSWIWVDSKKSFDDPATFNVNTGQHSSDCTTVVYDGLKSGHYRCGIKPEDILEGVTPISHSVMCVSPIQ